MDYFILNEMMYKPKNTKIMDDCFANLLKNKNVESSLRTLEKVVKKEFNMDSTIIRIVEVNPKSNYFFGMRVFPSKEELEGMALEIVTNKNKEIQFKKCTNIIIEIDSKIITKNDYFEEPFTPRELTAVLLHEIGHKIYSKEHFAVARKYSLINFLSIGGAVLGAAATTFGVAIVVFGLLLSFMVVTSRAQSDTTEKYADSFPVRYGYGKEIYSVLYKIGNINRSKKQDETTLSKWYEWSFGQLTHLGVRKKGIIEVIEKEIKESDDDYQKEVLLDQLEKIKSI
jgi:hypothetical protein